MGPRSLFDSPYAAFYHHFRAAANTDCFACPAEHLDLFSFISFASLFLSPILTLMQFPMPTRSISKKQAFLCASAIVRDSLRDKREIMLQPRHPPPRRQPHQSNPLIVPLQLILLEHPRPHTSSPPQISSHFRSTPRSFQKTAKQLQQARRPPRATQADQPQAVDKKSKTDAFTTNCGRTRTLSRSSPSSNVFEAHDTPPSSPQRLRRPPSPLPSHNRFQS